MAKKNLPKVMLPALNRGISFEAPSSAIARWNEALVAKEDDSKKEEDNTISVYDPIGYDFWTGEGVTAKRIAAALRHIGPKQDVVVNINSPGGDLFEGIAIYNLLRDHQGKVTTRVLGLAASAASIIALAGDEVQMARAGFMMIHNVWVMAMGNRNDLRDAADQLETFDDALASIYSARTGKEKKEVAKLMDKETWFSGDQAVEDGFADGLLPADVITERDDESEGAQAGVRWADTVLAKAGMPRSQRRTFLNKLKDSLGKRDAAEPHDRDTPSAVPQATHDAGVVEVVGSLTEFFKSKSSA